MFYLVIILFGVGWILISIIRNYTTVNSPISHKYLNHGKVVCQLKSILILIISSYIEYLHVLSYILHLYTAKWLKRKIVLTHIWLSYLSCFAGLGKRNPNENVITRGFSNTLRGPILVTPFIKLTMPRLFSATRAGVRYYNTSEPESYNLQEVQGIDVNSDITLNYFYEWLCGLTDGEGSFYILSKNNRTTFEFNYQICLHVDDVHMLNFIQNNLVIGKVSITGNTARFSVTRHKDIEKILDIFTKYPLNSTKLLNFFDFKKAFELYTSSKIKGENIVQQINDLKYSMNTHRTVFQMPLDFEPRITSYWLLGFVEGEGSFFVKKDQYKLTFTLTQSTRDLALMESIRDFLYNLPAPPGAGGPRPGGGVDRQNTDKTSIRISITSDSTNINPISRLTITKLDLIRSAIIPFFSSVTWRSKKFQDFLDWVTIFKLKERGHHYQEEGINVLNTIISQMNNKRLSTSTETSLSEVGREQLYLEINKLLNGPSNIEVKEEGRLFIKSLNSYYKGSGKTKVQIIDKKGLVFKTFISLSDCAKFLGVSQPTAKNRLVKNQEFLYENKPFYIKIISGGIDSSDSQSSANTSVLCLERKANTFTKLSLSTKDVLCTRARGNPVNIYEKCSAEGFKLIGSFVSARRAGLFLGISGSTITKYVQSGQIYKERYKFSSK
jgi:hypothetical protein